MMKAIVLIKLETGEHKAALARSKEDQKYSKSEPGIWTI